MGFHVRCSGAEFLRSLSLDAHDFFGAPYALYMIGLSTAVDEDALEWFARHELALDSLTGPIAAFVLFYNQARLKAEPFPRRRGVSVRYGEESTKDVEVTLPSEVLRAGAGAVDKVLRHHPDTRRADDIFITSMTYESDAIARQLGILDELPCIVVFDDPQSRDFYLLSLKNRTDIIFSELRNLLANFLRSPKNTAFLEAIEEWHDLKRRLERLNAEIEHLRLQSRYDPEVTLSRLQGEARPALLAGKAKRFRTILNEIESNSPTIHWKEVRAASENIALAVRLARGPYPFDDNGAVPGRRSGLSSYLSRAYELLSIDPAGGNVPPNERLPGMLKEYAEAQAEYLMQGVFAALDLSPSAPIESNRYYSWGEQARLAEQITGHLQRQLEMIKGMERPSLAAQFKALNRQEKNHLRVQKLRASALSMAEKGPSIIDAISSATDILSHL